MKRIMVPTDFSPTAEKAFRFAVDIASKTGGTVILYHVYTPLQSTFIETESKRETINKQTESILLKRMQRLKKKVTAPFTGVTVSTVLGRTPVITNILGFAEHNQVDLLVMGTQGAGGLKKKLIGSIAARIIDNADIPVLLVPEKYEWKEPRQVVYTSGYLASDRNALAVLLPLAALYAAATTIIHLYDIYAGDEIKEKNNFDDYAFAMQREFSEYKLTFRLMKTASVTETMENLVNEIDYDMVAMVRRKKTITGRYFFESFTKNMAYVTERLLLVMPENE
jgi:nucleotide-binding universal stress UspA family protein